MPEDERPTRCCPAGGIKPRATSPRNIAAQSIRTDIRRRNREKEAAVMNEHPETDAAWEEIAPHLDAALAELSEPDRDAVLLRYFENKPAQEMAAILGISAEAAQKRVSRAVERLRENFAGRGITAGAGGLSGAISANAVQLAPAGLATALFSGAVTTTALATITHSLAITTMGKVLIAASITVLVGTTIYQMAQPATRDTTASFKKISPAANKDTRPRTSNSLSEAISRSRAERTPEDRKRELENWKKRWVEINSEGSNGIITEWHQALARETAESLLCGDEAMELIRHLKYNKMSGWASVVRDGISDFLKSARAADARKLLTMMPDKPANSGTEGHDLLETWCNAAGRGCPAGEFEEYHAALKSESYAQEACFGRNLELMLPDPEAAIRSTLLALESNVQSQSDLGCLKLLFQEKLPPDVDFIWDAESGSCLRVIPRDRSSVNSVAVSSISNRIILPRIMICGKVS
jgi:hypothetical protein